MRENAEDKLFRRMLYGIGSVIVVGAIGFGLRYLLFEYQVSVITKATNDIQESSAKAMAKIQADAAAARQATLDRESRARQMKADAERQQIAARQAEVDAANREAAAKEVAWSRFYRPSKTCEPYDMRATMECANEYARAKKAFEQQWASNRGR